MASDDGGVTLSVLSLCVLSGIMHASWNLAMRQVKGDVAVLTGGLALSTCLLAPVALLDLARASRFPFDALPYVVATGVAHVVYIFLLSSMYSHQHGAVSVVYPVARGTGVMLTAIIAGPVLGESIQPLNALGILSIVCGVTLLGAAKAGVLVLGPLERGPLKHCWRQRETNPATRLEDEPAAGVSTDAREVETGQGGSKELMPAAKPATSTAERMESAGTVVQEKTATRGNGCGAVLRGILCGGSIACYSLVDKAGVSLMNPIPYLTGMLIVELLGILPYLLHSARTRDMCVEAWRCKKRFILIMGIGPTGTYLIILYALTVAPASIVVALREVSVVFAAIFGVVILGEQVTLGLLMGVLFVGSGLVLTKLA